MSTPLFTPRFFVMCAFSFTVFISLFQLLPAAPYHILSLGGTTAVAGLFLGFLTYASALSAPFTGTLGDRFGLRRVLIVVSLVLAGFTASYALIPGYRLLLAVVIAHGLIWSALMSASAAYMTSALPDSRRAEGLGYWGLSSIMAFAIAPPLGFWVYSYGWVALCLEMTALNLMMAAIAWRLPDDRASAPALATDADPRPIRFGAVVEWPVLVLSMAMACVSFGYGALTSFSALFADALGVVPNSLFLTVLAATVLLTRVAVGRQLDRLGHRRALLPCFAASGVGLVLVALAQGKVGLIAAAVVFGSGFGLMYPLYAAYIIGRVPYGRRGAAFGAMLAAFDTGIGTGSTSMGWLIHHFGFRPAFGVAAALALLALPYFLVAEKRIGYRS